MFDSIQNIKVCDIDLTDGRFNHFNSSSDLKRLAASIKSSGLISPVLVKPVNGGYIAVSGFNRIKAFDQLKEPRVPAFIVPETEDDFITLKKAIISVTFKRVLSQKELISCVTHLSQYIDALEIAGQAEGLFNVQLNPKYVKELIAIGCMDHPALELIDSGRLAFKTAKKIVGFPGDDQRCLLKLFSRIKASASIQREIVQHLFELSKRDKIKIESILASKDMSNLLNDTGMEPVMLTRELRYCIYKMRFPNLAQAQRRMSKKISALKSGNGMKIETSDTFEDSHVSFSFKINTMQQFKASVELLQRMAQGSELADILKQ